MNLLQFFKRKSSVFDKKNTIYNSQHGSGFSSVDNYVKYKNKYIPYLTVLVLLGGLGITLYQVQQKQENRIKAAPESQFQKVTLDNDFNNPPIELTIAPDGKVFYIQRQGMIKIYYPDGKIKVIGSLNVDSSNEDGLMGIELDPNFSTNKWIYLFYSPVSPNIQRLSRFTLNPDDTLNISTEKVILSFPTIRTVTVEGSPVGPFHSAGSIHFGTDGNLYIATGDETNYTFSDGFAPLDERPGHVVLDAQKSSSNTNDLRGKILRIKPQPDGSYSIPSGNLFPPGTALTRPEIYAMGLRNPYRFSIDSRTGWLYIGDIGPSAANDNPTRGPKQYEQLFVQKNAANFGWPYCISFNRATNKSYAYIDYDFATKQSGSAFNCDAPVNNSPNNTGLTNLPPVQPPILWYNYGNSVDFPQFNAPPGQASNATTIMAGPLYYFDSQLNSDIKFPQEYDRSLIVVDWSRNIVREVKLDTNGTITSISPFLPSTLFDHPIAMEFGPNGALYMIEYGKAWWENDPTGLRKPKLVRIEYTGNGHSPIANANANLTSGRVPLAIQFNSAGTSDPDNDTLSYKWDFTSDGTVDSTASNPAFTYQTTGNYMAKLTVTDSTGKTAVSHVSITVGNTAPTIDITTPVEGGFFEWGDKIEYSTSVQDAEDGPTGVQCGSVNVLPSLGHDYHTHDQNSLNSCAGIIDTLPHSTGGGDNSNTFYTLTASYKDRGAVGVSPIEETKSIIIQPRHKEAEFFTKQSGNLVVENSGADAGNPHSIDPAGGGANLGFIKDGYWISFKPVNLKNISTVTYRVATPHAGNYIEARIDSPTGAVVSTITIPATGPSNQISTWGKYVSISGPISDPGGTHELYFVFKHPSGVAYPDPANPYLFNLNWIEFNGQGIAKDLPKPWKTWTVNPNLPGYTNYRNDTFTLYGNGADIWLANDSFHYAYQNFLGDGEITARLDSVTQPATYAKAGLMIRENGSGNSPNALILLQEGGSLYFTKRSTTNGQTEIVGNSVSVPLPVFIRIKKAGNTYTASYSKSGAGYTVIGTTTIAMNATMVGMAVNSNLRF